LRSPAHSAALALAAAALFATAGCSGQPRPAKAAVKPAKDRQAAPDFTLKDASGQTVKLSQFKGKVVLLNFWATWCGPCKIEIPWFIAFEKQYKDRGFAVVGVAMDEDGWDVVKPYIETRQVNYRVVMGDDVVAQLYGGVESLPTTFLIDREGRVASVHIGLVSKSTYQHDIDLLMESSGARAGVGGGAEPAAGGSAE
jgi:thiol-disulfide isomerase/thioredoxin